MRRLVLACALALASPLSFAAKPTDAQIDHLLEVMHSRALLESSMAQLETNQAEMVHKSLGEQQLTAGQREVIDRVIATTAHNMRDAMTWDKLLPMYRRIYGETFDSTDIDAMIGFYETPEGQRVVERYPAVVQKTTAEMQALLVPLLQQMQKDMAAEMSAAKVEKSLQ